MSARRGVLALGLAVGLAGCVSERVIGLELRPPRGPDGGPDVPAALAAWEVRLVRLEGDEGCPGPEASAAGRTPRLGHAQSFPAADGMGVAIGEVPPGRWAVTALGRDADCGVRLHGCAELVLDDGAPTRLVVETSPVATGATCGCRACDAGVCAPLLDVCE
ncbi:MAG TPA: hypothetical protein RMH99_23025 [Sandaracinaceae bacterium LLY-WYZ-13_1]|nr:hypothetical protein [Sandaracinaceae bacterium LLY-WYZ-13_1]